jgi:hypothetical protein
MTHVLFVECSLKKSIQSLMKTYGAYLIMKLFLLSTSSSENLRPLEKLFWCVAVMSSFVNCILIRFNVPILTISMDKKRETKTPVSFRIRFSSRTWKDCSSLTFLMTHLFMRMKLVILIVTWVDTGYLLRFVVRIPTVYYVLTNYVILSIHKNFWLITLNSCEQLCCKRQTDDKQKL